MENKESFEWWCRNISEAHLFNFLTNGKFFLPFHIPICRRAPTFYSCTVTNLTNSFVYFYHPPSSSSISTSIYFLITILVTLNNAVYQLITQILFFASSHHPLSLLISFSHAWRADKKLFIKTIENYNDEILLSYTQKANFSLLHHLPLPFEFLCNIA